MRTSAEQIKQEGVTKAVGPEARTRVKDAREFDSCRLGQQ